MRRRARQLLLVFGVVSAIANLATWLAGCGPTYVLSTGTAVDDPHRLVPRAEVEQLVATLLERVPADDVASVGRWDGATLHLQRHKERCVKGVRSTGCSDVDAQEAWVAVRSCADGAPWQGTVAHELGHLLGKRDHRDGRWFGAGSLTLALEVEVCGVSTIADNEEENDVGDHEDQLEQGPSSVQEGDRDGRQDGAGALGSGSFGRPGQAD